MDAYLFPIKTAIISFIGFSSVLTVPYMLIQYRKYGSVSKFRSLILFSFFLYMLCAYYLVILPLPDPKTLGPIINIMNHMQLIPFKFIYDFITHTSLHITNISTYLPALKENVFYVQIFNIMITIPFGVYMAYYFKKDLKHIVLYTFLLSLFFEITQLTGLYWLYPSPYRLFDIDDLILNTMGGVIGYFVYKKYLLFLPSKEKIDEKSIRNSEKVGYIRRAFSFSIDYNILLSVFTIITNILTVNNEFISLSLFHISLFSYFILSHLLFKKTIGEKIVNIKLQLKSKKQNYNLSIILKYGILILTIFILSTLSLLVDITYENGIYALIYILVIIGIFIDFLFSFKRNKTMFYENISKTSMKNTKK